MAEKPRAVIIVGALAVAIAAFAAYSLYNYLKSQEEKASEAIATYKIVVAAAEIPIGNTVKVTQLKAANWPKAIMPKGTFASIDMVVGRVALQTFLPNDPITEAKLISKEGMAGILTHKIPEGHRAMTVSVDQVAGVAGFVNPGNMVDVVLTTTPPGATQTLSKIVLQNVPILATGQTIENREGKAAVVPTVTMDVTPGDAENLAIASTQGKLQLVLRRAGDTALAKTGGATVTKVISGAAVAEMPKAKVSTTAPLAGVKHMGGITSVEVWRGNKKSVETFTVKEGGV